MFARGALVLARGALVLARGVLGADACGAGRAFHEPSFPRDADDCGDAARGAAFARGVAARSAAARSPVDRGFHVPLLLRVVWPLGVAARVGVGVAAASLRATRVAPPLGSGVTRWFGTSSRGPTRRPPPPR